jgi:hypothetical protein
MDDKAVLRDLVPAKVLSLIRDGHVTTLEGLCNKWNIRNLEIRSDFEGERARAILSHIVDNLAEAGLISTEGGKLAPTALVAKIQQALHLSLTDLSEMQQRPHASDFFVDPLVIKGLCESKNKKYDLGKVVRFCEELNSSYFSGNYLASTLLIRALLNHIPPVFGHTAFNQVVSQSARSVKELLKPLEETSRDVADLHTHSGIRHKENLPTRNQVEPFKANLEVLLHEIIAKVQEPG